MELSNKDRNLILSLDSDGGDGENDLQSFR